MYYILYICIIYIHIVIPLGNSSKESDSPSCPNKCCFFLGGIVEKQCFPHGYPGLYVFWQGQSWVIIFREGILRANWHAFKQKNAKTAVMRRYRLYYRWVKQTTRLTTSFKCFVAFTWLTRTPDSWENCLYVFFVVGFLGHDFLEGRRPRGILGSDSLDVHRCAISVV